MLIIINSAKRSNIFLKRREGYKAMRGLQNVPLIFHYICYLSGKQNTRKNNKEL